jgi:hypothetical protein
MLRTVPVEICRVSVPARRWNSSGAGGQPEVLVAVVAGDQRDLPIALLEAGDDRGQHLGEAG